MCMLSFFAMMQSQASKERLLNDSQILNRVAQDAMEYQARPEDVRTRLSKEFSFSIEEGPPLANKDTYDFVMPYRKNWLGLGGRWILVMEINAQNQCEHAWLEFQPTGYI